ncbi:MULTISPECIES: serine protease [unclassified Bradyrhizobium]|uniref:S1 family peptidase n=1 Tax=unclassified Bradyrhizobium TaxID=2631580 RepID=UPI0029170E39|nr:MULTISPECIES: serine protease [unclassified Bradyrhizobium]
MDKRLLYAAYRLSTMHAGPDGSSKEVHGTCFFVKSDALLFAVTNRHNLDLTYKDQKFVGYKPEAFKISGYADNKHYYETTPTGGVRFVFATNLAEDVAVLDLTDGNMQYGRRRKPGETPGTKIGPPSLHSSAIDMLANDEDLQRMAVGAQIWMPSYSLHYDKGTERPVMRTGVVSSDPDSDYQTEGDEPARRVLIQVQSAPGASGAPVFAQLDSEAVLLGVNAGQLLTGGMPSGFSYCFKAQCIRDCIEHLTLLRAQDLPKQQAP